MKFDSSYLWSPKYAKWIIISFFALFLLLFIREIVSVFTFRHQINTVSKQAIVSSLTLEKQKIKVENFDKELFGTYIPPDISSGDVKESKLNLEVVSILFSDDTENSLVVIRSAGEEHLYKMGDTLPGEVVIKSIMADGVLVEHNGSLESLRLPEDALNFEAAPKNDSEDETESW